MNKYLAGVELVLKNGETKDIVYVIPSSTDELSANNMLIDKIESDYPDTEYRITEMCNITM